MARKVLQQFTFRKVTYKPSRKLKGEEFNETELSILERMGKLSPDDEVKAKKVTQKSKEDES